MSHFLFHLYDLLIYYLCGFIVSQIYVCVSWISGGCLNHKLSALVVFYCMPLLMVLVLLLCQALWIQTCSLHPQMVQMQRHNFASHLQMQQTGSIGAILQLVGHLHLMVSFLTWFGFQGIQCSLSGDLT